MRRAGAVEQVLPAQSAGPFADVVEMKASADQAGDCGQQIDEVASILRPWALISCAVDAARDGKRRDDERRDHRFVFERSAMVLDSAVGKDRGRKRACGAIEPAGRGHC